jgi:hypothetical protein
MARFIQSEVAGGVILAGKRTGQTAAWAGIDSLRMWFESMLIPHWHGFTSHFVTVETVPAGHGLSALSPTNHELPQISELQVQRFSI